MNKPVFAAGKINRTKEYSYRFFVGQKPTGFDIVKHVGNFRTENFVETGESGVGYYERFGQWPQPSHDQICKMRQYA